MVFKKDDKLRLQDALKTLPITIVGAGPVGLLLANLLGSEGRRVTVIEKHAKKPSGSMAIGITPPSLDILDQVNLRSSFLDKGVRIQRAYVFENRKKVGQLTFPGPENAILSFPQSETLTLLEKNLQNFPSVSLTRGRLFTEEELRDAKGWVIGCDGSSGTVRKMAKIKGHGHGYGVGFVMADFPDVEELGPDARLYFTKNGAVESFPLPGNRRRWIAQVPGNSGRRDLRERVLSATGIDLKGRASSPLNSFAPKWFLADQYSKGNVILCGDAAHVMSPIGGQGMNTGFGDAAMLADLLNGQGRFTIDDYTRRRQKAFRISARRAAMGMWLGTRQGRISSYLRSATLKLALRVPASENTLARTFTMRNVPHPCNP